MVACLQSQAYLHLHLQAGFEDSLKQPAPEPQAPGPAPRFWRVYLLEELGSGRFDEGVWEA